MVPAVAPGARDLEYRTELVTAAEVVDGSTLADQLTKASSEGWDLEARSEADSSWPEQLNLRASLMQAMGHLTERQAAVVYLRYFQEREFEDIAAILNVKASTARSLLRHGLRHLREILHSEGRPAAPRRAGAPRFRV